MYMHVHIFIRTYPIMFCMSLLYILQFYHVILYHYAYMRYYVILVDICVDHMISHSIRFNYASFCSLS